MTIRAQYQIDDAQVNKMDLSITLTMSVHEWRELMRVIPNNWPGWDVCRTISEALGEISRATSKKYSTGCET